MTKKPIYIIVQEHGAASLQVSVNDFIENGYMPIGGVSMILSEFKNG